MPKDRRQRGENRHERLPEQVMGPLIVWATRFVDVFAPDILAAAAQWSRRRDTDAAPPPSGPRGPELASALEHLQTVLVLPTRRDREVRVLRPEMVEERLDLGRLPLPRVLIGELGEPTDRSH